VLNDQRRQRRFTPQQYLRSADEMIALFSDIPEAIQNSVEIAKRCNYFLEVGDYYLPNYPVPENLTPEQHLREKSRHGLTLRLEVKGIEADEAYWERLELELDVIAQMGFPGYFLIVADFIEWAKTNEIPVGPGRGSGAGSLVAYVLGITELDPIQHGLLFERFLNPERVSLPDFDIDFCIEGRDRVIDYVAGYYGREKVSQIITHGTMAARAVVRDVGRVMGMAYGHVDKIAKLIPFQVGVTLDQALKQEELLKEQYEKDDDVKQLMDTARALEGLPRNVGKHAGGVVIAPSALTEFTALYCEQGSEQTVTHLDKDDLETIGLVKFDFLGLRTLTIIDKTLRKVNQLRKDHNEEPIVLDKLDIDDPDTYQLLKSCRTTALFQLESRGMKDLIQRLQPDRFEDLIALVALYRPGPLQSGMVEDFIDRKHGRARLSYSHPALEPILKPTYGVILYQEQVMEIAKVLAGYSLGSADLLRRAMGKKKPEAMARQREVFLQGAHERGVEERTANHIFDLMEKFAGYGFNRSHSAAYALITYQTAWLKAHYPAQFMAAALSADMEHTDKIVTLIAECREMGLEVLSPDINHCEFSFEATQDGRILYGLGAVKGIGYAVIEAVVEARSQGGEFSDLFDLCERVDVKRVNRRAMESLIKSGALDSLGPHRASLMASLTTALNVAGQQSSDRSAGQSDLFGVSPPQQSIRAYRDAPEWSKDQVLAGEKETLGLYLSGHPIDAYRDELAQITDACLSELRPSEDRNIVVAGLVVGLRMMNTRRGDRMAFVTLDDKTARLEIAVFSDLFSKSRDALRKDNLFALENILESSPAGGCRVVFQYVTPSERVTLPAGQQWRVHPTGNLLKDVGDLVGEQAVRLVYKPITFIDATPVASTG
jgi:DNA polymerase-3 subunit alpha